VDAGIRSDRHACGEDRPFRLTVPANASEGANFAAALINSGVTVDFRNYPGVTHEFFSMGAVLDEAKQANQQAAANLKKAFGIQ
jgi:acetyl esterase/lipase